MARACVSIVSWDILEMGSKYVRQSISLMLICQVRHKLVSAMSTTLCAYLYLGRICVKYLTLIDLFADIVLNISLGNILQ